MKTMHQPNLYFATRGHRLPSRIAAKIPVIPALLLLFSGCQNSTQDTPSRGLDVSVHLPVNEADASDSQARTTFFEDVLPVLEARCISCHQDGGIAPFALDDVEVARDYAGAMQFATEQRTMPPWSATSDGSCGNFRDSIALTDEEIELFRSWLDTGLAAGTERPVFYPTPGTLPDATTLLTPEFVPERAGTQTAENDEYRCFVFDSPSSAVKYITGYSVEPGTPEIVHHLVAFLVDPDAPSELPDKTNAEVMQALDAASPDRIGWDCFGAAGDGVAVNGLPAVWAPGQGVMEFPSGSGAPLLPTYKIVVQMHYNLEDSANVGKADQTKLHLRLEDSVERVGMFVVPDEFLSTYFQGEPATLEPGQKSVKYTWSQSMAELGIDSLPGLQLAGVMPHMHELGHEFRMNVAQDAGSACAVNVEQWDFHWQRMYFYDQPLDLAPNSSIQVTCDFDTSGRRDPVYPGWGTQNEMCAAILYVTAPIEAF